MTKTKLIVNLTSGDAVCVGELADRPLRRMRGLIGRGGLPAGEGLLLRPAPSIHTAFMRFPIDAVFLDRNLQVVHVVERLRPWRFASKRRARAVLELSAGESARCGIEVGDKLELCDRHGEGISDLGRGETGDGPPQGDLHLSPLDTPRPLNGGELSRLRPLRVLVNSPDRQFRTVMSLLLARRNYAVVVTAHADSVAELITRENTDVVVIDTNRLATLATTAATVEGVEALARPVGLVLVADEAQSGLPGRVVVAKWGPFEDLVAAIAHADQRRGSGGDTNGHR